MPSWGFHIKAIDLVARIDGSRVNQSWICSTTNDYHIEFADSDCCVALATWCFDLQAILYFAHLVGLRIEHLHILEDFILIIKTSIQIHLIVHTSNRVVNSRWCYFVTISYERDLENSFQFWVDNFYGARVGRAEILEAVESVVQDDWFDVDISEIMRHIWISNLVWRPILGDKLAANAFDWVYISCECKRTSWHYKIIIIVQITLFLRLLDPLNLIVRQMQQSEALTSLPLLLFLFVGGNLWRCEKDDTPIIRVLHSLRHIDILIAWTLLIRFKYWDLLFFDEGLQIFQRSLHLSCIFCRVWTFPLDLWHIILFWSSNHFVSRYYKFFAIINLIKIIFKRNKAIRFKLNNYGRIRLLHPAQRKGPRSQNSPRWDQCWCHVVTHADGKSWWTDHAIAEREIENLAWRWH